MKTIACPVVSLLTLIVLLSPAHAEPSKYTANHVRGHSITELGKEVSIDVSWVQPILKVASEEFAVYAAHTWDEREKVAGGIIAVVIPKSDAAKFVSRYETSPDIEKRRGKGGGDLDTRRLTGVLRESGRKTVYIDLTDGEAAKAKLRITTEGASDGGSPARGKTRGKGKN